MDVVLVDYSIEADYEDKEYLESVRQRIEQLLQQGYKIVTCASSASNGYVLVMWTLVRT